MDNMPRVEERLEVVRMGLRLGDPHREWRQLGLRNPVRELM